VQHLDAFQDGFEDWALQAVAAVDDDQGKLHASGPVCGNRCFREGAAESQRPDGKPCILGGEAELPGLAGLHAANDGDLHSVRQMHDLRTMRPPGVTSPHLISAIDVLDARSRDRRSSRGMTPMPVWEWARMETVTSISSRIRASATGSVDSGAGDHRGSLAAHGRARLIGSEPLLELRLKGFALIFG
jgi:hypothetical protein